MKIMCISNTGNDLSVKSKEALSVITNKFDLNIGNVYTIYGIALWKGMISYLLIGEECERPYWYPSDLFQIVDHMLPFDFYFSFLGYEENEPLNAIWGYKELVMTDNHYNELIEREPEAIEIFFKRKKEIDEDEELNKFRFKK